MRFQWSVFNQNLNGGQQNKKGISNDESETNTNSSLELQENPFEGKENLRCDEQVVPNVEEKIHPGFRKLSSMRETPIS